MEASPPGADLWVTIGSMLAKEQIREYLGALAEELSKLGVKGELCLYGGAVMCLAYDARPATKDIDAVFVPTQQIRDAARKVADAYSLPDDWLNDAVKGFVVSHPRRILMELPSLQVFIPEPDYLLAMKTLSARVDATDKADVLFLIGKMGLKTPQEVFQILAKYYPNEQIRPATQYFIEELFQR
jgi:hypothetical protein